MPYCSNCDNPEADHFTARCPKPVKRVKKVNDKLVAVDRLEKNDLVALVNECPTCSARREKERLRKQRYRQSLKE